MADRRCVRMRGNGARRPGLEADAGLVYLTGVRQRAASGLWTPVLLGINAVNGQLKWRFTATGVSLSRFSVQGWHLSRRIPASPGWMISTRLPAGYGGS